MNKCSFHPAVGWIVYNSPRDRAFIHLSEVQLCISTSYQPGSQIYVIRAFSDVKKRVLNFRFGDFNRQIR